jgi:cytochrome c biogenesis protein CcmG, thiol:disulfide interchange protein DsbE
MRSGAWRACAVLLALGAVIAALTGCGSDEPRSAARSTSDFKQALAAAPAPLKRLYSQPAELIDGGPDAFNERLRTLHGYPVVVNKWASWCGPCRFEFPFFQRVAKRRGKQIAFMGVNAQDARDAAQKFLRKYPVPYPSFFDPDLKVAKLLEGERSFPVTAFFDRKGELVYTKQGGYASEEVLEKDLRQYAR